MIPNTAYGKGWSSCDVVRNSQMLVIGGYAANKSWPQCDVPGFGGQHGLLLGQEYTEVDRPKLHWWWRLWHEFNEYRVPDKIVSLVGGKCVLHTHRVRSTYNNKMIVSQAMPPRRRRCKAGQRLPYPRISRGRTISHRAQQRDQSRKHPPPSHLSSRSPVIPTLAP
jgi:hypothetical protein